MKQRKVLVYVGYILRIKTRSNSFGRHSKTAIITGTIKIGNGDAELQENEIMSKLFYKLKANVNELMN